MDLAWDNFRRPQRYIGNEWNVISKKHSRRIPICLCFPDLYEIGMSNLGLRILYAAFNQFDDVVCERSFMPGVDLYKYLKKNKKKLFSLESKTALDKFQVLGFNLNCELNYTNFLAMLELAGLPLEATRRGQQIVLGGGLVNPEPLADFVDVFFLGEFEEYLPSFLKIMRQFNDKQQRLRALSEVKGFYVPQFYSANQQKGKVVVSKIYPHARLPLERVHVKDLDSSFYPTNWLLPHTRIVHDRAQIEIARGCPNKCFFCQAQAVYSPYRQRSHKQVLNLMKAIYDSSGYENLSLLALSASNHSQIDAIINEAADFCRKYHIGLSLPSLRIEHIVGSLYQVLRRIKRVSATFAVEAATTNLRKRINKNIDIDKLITAGELLKSLGTRHAKLYFMFGLPGEEDGDLLAIGDLVKNFQKKTKLGVNLSINPFIPKPFSLFQGKSMLSWQQLETKQALIKGNLPRNKKIKVSFNDSWRSILEGIISCADRSFAQVIKNAYQYGACYDSDWSLSNKQAWLKAFEAAGFDYQQYMQQGKNSFPWSHIKVGNIEDRG